MKVSQEVCEWVGMVSVLGGGEWFSWVVIGLSLE